MLVGMVTPALPAHPVQVRALRAMFARKAPRVLPARPAVPLAGGLVAVPRTHRAAEIAARAIFVLLVSTQTCNTCCLS